MDILEMKQEAAMQQTDEEVARKIREWTHPIGTLVEGRVLDDLSKVTIGRGRTTSMGISRWPCAVVQIDTGEELILPDVKLITHIKGTVITAKKIFAIQQVLTVNNDVASLLESKGVTRDDINELCKRATEWVESRSPKGKKR